MTEQLHMASFEGTYTRQFSAMVEAVHPGIVELDRTAFYPFGGGQPADQGKLQWEGGTARVEDVRKRNRLRHMVAGDLPEVGATVEGSIDWDRRYAHMKMHTSQHLVSAVVDQLHGARTVGNQLYADKARIDFQPLRLSPAQLSEVEAEANRYLAKDLPVTITEADRSELEQDPLVRSNLSLLPPSIRRLRVISIGNLDICPCAGTHVRSLGEIGEIEFTKRDNKGSGKQRLTYTLRDPTP
ncbi:MAG: alanyl-tRNA editing protein [Methanobacteriota archaeon]|nr:MAG: alanyl-tRNA editing protein [Euryarchaeota archaeon]